MFGRVVRFASAPLLAPVAARGLALAPVAPRELAPVAPRALAVALALAAPAVLAHDTWFQPLPDAKPGAVLLALGTGNQFPVQESGVAIEYLRSSGCRSGDAVAVPFAFVRDAPTALVVRAGAAGAAAPVSCWAQLAPFEIELVPDKIDLYLKEINASPAARDAWAGMRARGLAWKERYTKHARIELAPPAGRGATPQTPRPPKRVEMGMDVLLESGLGPIAAGDRLVFQVLRDGAPLADFAVELRSERSRFGIWLRTDAEGRVRVQAPFAGRWVLRGTDLRLADASPDRWESRFVTLAFEVAPPR